MRTLKYSGISWYGDIPSTWAIAKIKDLFSVISGSTPDSNNLSYWDGDINWITPADYKTGDKYVSKGRKSISQNGYDSCGTTMIPKGSVIFSKRAPIGSVAINTALLCTNQGCLSCIPNNATSSLYYYYVMSVLTEAFELYGSGTTFKEISAKDFSSFHIPFPPYNEQQCIADFLDRKCADIDNVLEKTKASIEEYKKLKQSVITEAVTKGNRGERPMKDSGIEWIGKIPKEWSKYRKLSSICSKGISYGIVKLFDPDENGVKVLRCSDVQPGYILTDNIRTVTKELSNEYKRTILNGGEIVINVRGTLGGCAIVPDSMKGYNIAREVALVDTFGINKKYLMYFFLSDLFKLYQQMNLAGSVYVGLNIELLSSCPILKPSLDEQQEITEYLDKKCSEIDSLIASKEKFITELESYKKSLIYEYVTGKKEVL